MSRQLGRTSEQLLREMKGIPEVKVSVVEQVPDGAVLLRHVGVGKLWQELTEVLPLGIGQHFAPRAFAHHGEEDFRLMQNKGRQQR